MFMSKTDSHKLDFMIPKILNISRATQESGSNLCKARKTKCVKCSYLILSTK